MSAIAVQHLIDGLVREGHESASSFDQVARVLRREVERKAVTLANAQDLFYQQRGPAVIAATDMAFLPSNLRNLNFQITELLGDARVLAFAYALFRDGRDFETEIKAKIFGGK